MAKELRELGLEAACTAEKEAALRRETHLPRSRVAALSTDAEAARTEREGYAEAAEEEAERRRHEVDELGGAGRLEGDKARALAAASTAQGELGDAKGEVRRLQR
jgi:hypothetical protein